MRVVAKFRRQSGGRAWHSVYSLDGFRLPIEEVAPAIKRPMWFQLYVLRIAALCVTRWSEQKQRVVRRCFHRGYADTGRTLP